MKIFIAGILTAVMSLLGVSAFAEEDKLHIYVAGDSTGQTYNQKASYPQFGWGQVFWDVFTDDVIVDNRAIGGRSAMRFDNEGSLDKILDVIKPGDYLFIQFGINDGDKRYESKYTPIDEYKRILKERFMGETEKRGAIPVLLTPSAGAVWDEKKSRFKESRVEYADATRELAKETGCKFIDINRIMIDTYNKMGKEAVVSGYLDCEPLESAKNPAGLSDHAHFKEKGARLVTKLIAEAIPQCVPELAKYLKDSENFVDIYGNAYEEDIKRAVADKIIIPSGDCRFNPDAYITRAEFLQMAMNAANIPGHGYRANECLDATSNDWYCYYLQGALDKGLIPIEMTGVLLEPKVKILEDATDKKDAETMEVMSYRFGFKGDMAISREEMASIAISCLLYTANQKGKERSVYIFGEDFNDADTSPWAKPFIEVAASYGLVFGDDEGMFHPKENVTRAQAVMVINRIAEQLR